MSTTYDIIDEELKKRRWSRRKLAEIAGININTMSTIFARRVEPFPEKYLEPIAKALDIAAHELKGIKIYKLMLPGEEEEPPFRLEPIAKAIAHRATKCNSEEIGGLLKLTDLIDAFKGLNEEGQDLALKIVAALTNSQEYRR